MVNDRSHAPTRQREAEGLVAIARTINTLDFDALHSIVRSASTLLAADVTTLYQLPRTRTR